MCIMDNGNDLPSCIPFWKFLMKNMIPTNSGLNCTNRYNSLAMQYIKVGRLATQWQLPNLSPVAVH